MNLNEIAAKQAAMDEAHGFPVRFSGDAEKYAQLTRDLVGLFGEIGEFSNIVKKINIKLERPIAYELDMVDVESRLREELIDTLIYVIRIGNMMNVDLQSELLKKMEFNTTRYESLRAN